MSDDALILAMRETGQGLPLVLLHGLFGQGGNFGAIARRLSARYRVLMPDLRNHGTSPHAATMAYPQMAADLLATLAQANALPALLMGHSMGGKVAMAAAQAAPESVARLCVSDIAPRAYPPSFDRYAAAMAALPLAPGLSRGEADRALADAVPDAGVRAFLLQNLRLDPPGWRIGLPAITAALPEISGWVPPEAPAYAGPTLFVAGERSDYILPSDHPAILRRFPRARFATVEGAGHWVHAEAPERFLAVLEPFLAG